MDNKQNEELEIDLKQICSLVLRRAWIILLAGALFGVCAFAYCSFIAEKQYISKTQIYVIDKQSEDITSTDLTLFSALSNDYIQIIKTRPVLQDVINELKLNIKIEELMNKIAVSKEGDSRIISISVTDSSPIKAKRIADAIAKASAGQIYEVMDAELVNVIQPGNVPESPASPNTMKNTLIMFVLGSLVSCIIVIVKFFLDDTIVSPEDVEKYLGLSVIGNIPVFGIEAMQYSKRAKTVERKKALPKKVDTKDIPILNRVKLGQDDTITTASTVNSASITSSETSTTSDLESLLRNEN